MIRRPPGSTLPDTPFPYPHLFRSAPDQRAAVRDVAGLHAVEHLRALARRGDDGGRNAQGRQGDAGADALQQLAAFLIRCGHLGGLLARSEEHTSELQSLMRSSYAVFCLKKTKRIKTYT